MEVEPFRGKDDYRSIPLRLPYYEGMTATPQAYTKIGIRGLKAKRVLAWNKAPENATRFLFD